ncbi:MAG TPA: hypothetical protein VF532_14390 [Candidatus Angelobacter sp.]
MSAGFSISRRIALALRRARVGILTMALAHAVGLGSGMLMVHAGNRFALNHRDRIISNARSSSPITRRLIQGQPAVAAALDCAANTLAATATALSGYWAPAPFPIALYRGWIGGVVSVDDQHRSRLTRSFSGGTYYMCVIVLQLVPYTLAGGAGVNLGLARVKPVGDYAGPRFLGLPHAALRDAGWIYVLVIPLFALASAFEFFWPS